MSTSKKPDTQAQLILHCIDKANKKVRQRKWSFLYYLKIFNQNEETQSWEPDSYHEAPLDYDSTKMTVGNGLKVQITAPIIAECGSWDCQLEFNVSLSQSWDMKDY